MQGSLIFFLILAQLFLYMKSLTFVMGKYPLTFTLFFSYTGFD